MAQWLKVWRVLTDARKSRFKPWLYYLLNV